MAIDKPEHRDEMTMTDAFKWPDSVPVKVWEDLTDGEKRAVLDAYRFSGYKTGMYQAISFIGPHNA